VNEPRKILPLLSFVLITFGIVLAVVAFLHARSDGCSDSLTAGIVIGSTITGGSFLIIGLLLFAIHETEGGELPRIDDSDRRKENQPMMNGRRKGDKWNGY